MSRIRIIGLALVAVFAMGAIASASASADNFTVFANSFTGKQVGEGELATAGGRDVKCKSGTANGEVSTKKTITSKGVTFTSCKSTKFGAGSCQSGSVKGEIVTAAVEGTLATKANENPKALIRLAPKAGGNFAEFNCETLLGAETLVVRGAVVCHLGPVNKLTKEFTLECKETGGVQDVTAFNGVKTELETEGKGPEVFAFEPSGEKATAELTTKANELIEELA